jgi:hypothetical protein
MDYRQIAIFITFGIIFIGFSFRLYCINSLLKRRSFTVSFRNLFIEMVNLFYEDYIIKDSLYKKYIHEVDAIQEELGSDGILSNYIDQGVHYLNYPVFSNVIPELRAVDVIGDNRIKIKQISHLVGICCDSLNRHIGNLERRLKRERKAIFNPFSCFILGIRFVIHIPEDILFRCGFVSHNEILSSNSLYKTIGMSVTIIGVVSSVTTIMLVWNVTLDYLIKVIQYFIF